MGNTYGDEEFEAASGYFSDFYFETWDGRAAPLSDNIKDEDFATWDLTSAVNGK